MPLWDKINVFFLLCSRLHTVVKTIPTFMVLATCAQRNYVTLGASCRRETVSRQKTELRTPLNRKGTARKRRVQQTDKTAGCVARHLCGAQSLPEHDVGIADAGNHLHTTRADKALLGSLSRSFAWVSKAWRVCCGVGVPRSGIVAGLVRYIELVREGSFVSQPAFLNF